MRSPSVELSAGAGNQFARSSIGTPPCGPRRHRPGALRCANRTRRCRC